MNVNTPAVTASRGRPWRSIALGVLLVVGSWVLMAFNGLLLMDYEDNHFEGWHWTPISRGLSSLPPGHRAAWWVSAIGSQVGMNVGVLLIGLGIYRFLKARRSAP
ncbi:hypothetical protein [Myxococcus sp. RHSTA-1-4]|uniref:hypothetical protein n=1 Tax=Myxococcus sp. RHSTA-1-4 TaxID=2874601 RepID=UPI001CBCEF87|nr:hypothetical protein [Myxococcus sp. RHSTA-1-4]MBZ4422357.1 hypothetical protein [Myxococcus sp. RHSTA-1-4]